MRRLFDFKCDNGHVNEKFVDTETNEVQCPDCELKARKIVTPVKVKREKNSWKEVRRWSKQRESHIKHERKQGVTL
jgi:hypothetical protein